MTIHHLLAEAERLEAADLVAEHEFDRLVDAGNVDGACSRMLTHLQRTETTRRRLYGPADVDEVTARYFRCHDEQFQMVARRIVGRLDTLLDTLLSPTASTPPVHGAKSGDLTGPFRVPQAQPPRAADSALVDESPRRHLEPVPDPPPAEPEVLCGQPSPQLSGFSCANPPHGDDQHWYMARRRLQVAR